MIPGWRPGDDPGRAFNHGRLLHCRYELVTDNLLDLSHLGSSHRWTLGNDADCPVRTERDGDMMRVTRWIVRRRCSRPPETSRESSTAGRSSRRRRPAMVYAGCGPADAGDSCDEGVRALDAPTPETETSTSYFCGHARDFRGAAWKRQTRDSFLQAFPEDAAILEAQQRSLDRPPVDIGVDAPGLAARRALTGRTKRRTKPAKQSIVDLERT